MSSFDSAVFGDFATREIQDAVRRFADGLDSRFIRGRLVEAQAFEAGETKLVPNVLSRSDARVMPLNIRARPASFRAYLSANQTGIATSTATDVEFDVESWDYGSVFNAAAHQFTAPVQGVYQFSTCLFLSGFPSSRFGGIQLVAGGATHFAQYNIASDVTGSYIVTGAWTLSLDPGDTARVQLFHNATSNQTINGGLPNETWFSGEIVGSPMPYVDDGNNANRSRFIPVHAERPLTCDLWVY